MNEIKPEDYDYTIHGEVLIYADDYDHPTVGRLYDQGGENEKWYFSTNGYDELVFNTMFTSETIYPPSTPTRIWLLPKTK